MLSNISTTRSDTERFQKKRFNLEREVLMVVQLCNLLVWIFLHGECFVHLACVECTAGDSARQICYKRRVL